MKRDISIAARTALRFTKNLVILTLIAAAVTSNPCPAESNLVSRPKRALIGIVDIQELSPFTREVAEQLEILPLLTQLFDKRQVLSKEKRAELRQEIHETIFESYLDAESVQAEAEREQGALVSLRQTLLAKRDHNVEVNNATNFIASGTLNTVGSILGFPTSAKPFVGNLNQMLGGVVSTTMSTYALKQNNGGKTRGEGNPTVIAELFGRPVDERTSYPESVWRFMHGRSLDHPEKTHAQVLEDRWISRHELEPHGSPREALKLNLVSGMAEARRSMTIKDLTDQINIIGDISSMAAQMTHHLRDLLHLIDTEVVEGTP